MAAAAAPAMLCYVTRPDAVLMEVEVEAKANGEDCLNQVTTGGQARVGVGWSPEAEGPRGGARLRGARLAGGRAALRRRPGGSASRALGPRPLLRAAVGHAVPAGCERVGGGCGGRARRACHPAPQNPALSRRRRPSTPAAGVCLMPPVGSLRGLAAPAEP